VDNIPDTDALILALPELNGAEFISAGGFKAVFRVELSDGSEEALKAVLLPDDESEDSRDQLVARVLREVEVLQRCSSPYLVKVGSFDPVITKVGDHDYLIYTEELLSGVPVAGLIGPPTSFETILSLTRCVLEAIHEIDKIGHIHRDIKPHNIMATGLQERPFVVLDLGIAFKVHGTELTPPGRGPLGTPLYMAPELFRPNYKDALDIRADIYSAGVTIFELAAGTHPLARRGEDLYTTMYRILHQRPFKLHTLRPDLPEWFCEMIDRSIKKTPALRFRDPGVFLKELEANL
jgi:serine/threonine protein kinase